MNVFIIIVSVFLVGGFVALAIWMGCKKNWTAMVLSIVMTIPCITVIAVTPDQKVTYDISHLQEQTVSYAIMSKDGEELWSFLKTDVNFKISDFSRVEIEVKSEKVKDVTIYMPQEKISEFLN